MNEEEYSEYQKTYEYLSDNGQRCVGCAYKPKSLACAESRKQFSTQCGLNAENHSIKEASIELPDIDIMFNHNQNSGRIHPYTCMEHSDTPLVLNNMCDTMKCPKCDYKQQFYPSDRTFTIQLYQTLKTTKDWKERIAESPQKGKATDGQEGASTQSEDRRK